MNERHRNENRVWCPPVRCLCADSPSQVSVECSLGALSLAKGQRYGVAFPTGYNASTNTLFFTGLQVRFARIRACRWEFKSANLYEGYMSRLNQRLEGQADQ